MRFQNRDGLLLEHIYENDGVVAKRQLKEKFWHKRSLRAMEQRLAKLRKARYIDWPSRDDYKIHPIPEPICWLDVRGAVYVAGRNGISEEVPKVINENKKRLLQKQLLMNDFRWVREPRWSLIRHDLAVIDFRYAVEAAANQLFSINVGQWITEMVFRSKPDNVSYFLKKRDGNVAKLNRRVIPDAYFEVIEEIRKERHKPYKIRLLLEMDMGTHDTFRFGREKVVPGIAYIKSSKYKRRFGSNSGLWLIVTTGGDRRIKNLMQQTKSRAGTNANLFYFSTMEKLKTDNLFLKPVWLQIDSDEQVALLT